MKAPSPETPAEKLTKHSALSRVLPHPTLSGTQAAVSKSGWDKEGEEERERQEGQSEARGMVGKLRWAVPTAHKLERKLS